MALRSPGTPTLEMVENRLMVYGAGVHLAPGKSWERWDIDSKVGIDPWNQWAFSLMHGVRGTEGRAVAGKLGYVSIAPYSLNPVDDKGFPEFPIARIEVPAARTFRDRLSRRDEAPLELPVVVPPFERDVDDREFLTRAAAIGVLSHVNGVLPEQAAATVAAFEAWDTHTARIARVPLGQLLNQIDIR